MRKAYSSKDGGCAVRVPSAAVRGGVEMSGMWLRAIGGTVRNADKSQCPAMQKGTTQFYGVLFNM